MQLSDSFFPTGMYSTSSGLETLFRNGRVKTPKGFERLASSYLRTQVGPADCVALGNAHTAARASDLPRVEEIDKRLFAMKLQAETREASTRMGRQLVRSVRGFSKDGFLGRYWRSVSAGRAPGTQPVALGVVSAAVGVEREDAASVLLYSSLVALVGAGVRLGIIDHVRAQAIIYSSRETVVELSRNSARDMGSVRQFFPALEIAQMEHERAEERMFAT